MCVCVKKFLSAAAKLSLESSGMWAGFRAGAVRQLPVLVTCSDVSVRCSAPEPCLSSGLIGWGLLWEAEPEWTEGGTLRFLLTEPLCVFYRTALRSPDHTCFYLLASSMLAPSLFCRVGCCHGDARKRVRSGHGEDG